MKAVSVATLLHHGICAAQIPSLYLLINSWHPHRFVFSGNFMNWSTYWTWGSHTIMESQWPQKTEGIPLKPRDRGTIPSDTPKERWCLNSHSLGKHLIIRRLSITPRSEDDPLAQNKKRTTFHSKSPERTPSGVAAKGVYWYMRSFHLLTSFSLSMHRTTVQSSHQSRSTSYHRSPLRSLSNASISFLPYPPWWGHHHVMGCLPRLLYIQVSLYQSYPLHFITHTTTIFTKIKNVYSNKHPGRFCVMCKKS